MWLRIDPHHTTQTETARPGEPWKEQDVVNWISSFGLKNYAPNFRSSKVDGPSLLRMRRGGFEALGITVCYVIAL